jgi:hypothetical protein
MCLATCGQRSCVDLLCLVEAAAIFQQPAEIAACLDRFRMLGAEHLSEQIDSLAIQRLRAVEIALIVQRRREVV